MSASDWIGEIVEWRGQLWDVTGTDWQNRAEGGLWLHLTDHYGSGAEDNALATECTVALQ